MKSDGNNVGNGSRDIYVGSVVSINSIEDKLLKEHSEYELAQNYPNPFNPSTTIEYTIPRVATVHLDIFNIT